MAGLKDVIIFRISTLYTKLKRYPELLHHEVLPPAAQGWANAFLPSPTQHRHSMSACHTYVYIHTCHTYVCMTLHVRHRQSNIKHNPYREREDNREDNIYRLGS